jgi:hypothetical protein
LGDFPVWLWRSITAASPRRFSIHDITNNADNWVTWHANQNLNWEDSSNEVPLIDSEIK